MTRMVALLRGINVGGRALPMAGLRALCAEIGWSSVETYIQSGNIVFAAEGKPAALENALEGAIEKRFGMKVPVAVRTGRQWAAYLKDNPFPEAARDAPNWLLLLVSKRPPVAGADQALEGRAAAGERVGRASDGLWICYPKGVGTSKLTPVLIDKLVGSPTTGRNYRTVIKLREMIG